MESARDHQIFLDGEQLVKGGGLEDDAQRFSGGGGEHFSCSGDERLGDDIEQGGFA